jgi:hypothetical protein
MTWAEFDSIVDEAGVVYNAEMDIPRKEFAAANKKYAEVHDECLKKYLVTVSAAREMREKGGQL